MYHSGVTSEGSHGDWATEIDFIPDPLAKQRALEDFARFLNPQKAVSYTHLDVYKRQRQGPRRPT